MPEKVWILCDLLAWLFCCYNKGPFKYYVIKKVGGWGWQNAYVCLQGGWVGVAKCLRNHKNHQIMYFLKRTNRPRRKAAGFCDMFKK